MAPLEYFTSYKPADIKLGTIRMLIANQMTMCRRRGDEFWHRAWGMYTVATYCGFGQDELETLTDAIYEVIDNE